jgi:predicted ATPase
MGEVYEAYDDDLCIPVALKTLHPDLSRERAALARLKLEVLLARSVAHPHVCRVYDIGHHGEGADAVWFLTMELLVGETLQERLRRTGPLLPSDAASLVEDMTVGLAAAHHAGVVHRDFKTANVMIVQRADRERAVVTDFGVARAARETVAGPKVADAIVGTPAYMAPEQVRGEGVGPAADIYALGVVLYELVTGALPFSGGTPWDVAIRRLHENPRSPRTLVPALDEVWESLILRCLAREPRDRFARVEEVVDALAGGASLQGAPREGPARGASSSTSPPRFTLPAERDAFVGREAELVELVRRAPNPSEGAAGAGDRDGSRLVTLVGAGGMGKTRLAVRFGWQSLKRWPGGVWFCDLSEARNRDGVAAAVAKSLGVSLGTGDPVEQLGHAIAARGHALLILDNFEQVVEHAQDTVGRWLDRTTEGCFLVTSRSRLRLRGEDVHAVEPLSIESGVDLFLGRARQVRPGYAAQGDEMVAVREAVRLAEGMPLAIELAAARMRVMTATQLVDRMRDRLRVLVGGDEGRHASLRSAIDASWELLPAWEQGAWIQAAVFEGGFTIEAAEAVIDMSPWPDSPWLVDVLQSLVDKSLLQVRTPNGPAGRATGVRFGMYESLQVYARAKLHGEEGARTAIELEAEKRHGAWYARYGNESALAAIGRRGGAEVRLQLESETENLRVACRRAVMREDAETAVATYLAAWTIFDTLGPSAAGVELGREVLSMALPDALRARVLLALGRAEWTSGLMDDARARYGVARVLAQQMGDGRIESHALLYLGTLDQDQGRMEEAHAHFEGALAIARATNDRHREGLVLGELGTLNIVQGHMEAARAHLESALEIHRELGNRREEGTVLGNLGLFHRGQGRTVEARANLEAALAIHRELGNRRSEGIFLGNLAVIDHDQGRLDEARLHYEATLAIFREVGNRRLEGNYLCNLGSLHWDQGRTEEALAHYEAALAIHRELGNRPQEGILVGNLGAMCANEGRREEALAHFEAALLVHREVGNRRFEGMVLANLGSLLGEEGRIEEARAAFEKGEAIHREVEDALELAKLLCLRAEFEFGAGERTAAIAALDEADALAAQVGAGPKSELGRELARVRRDFVRD